MEYVPITDNKTDRAQSDRLLELGLPAETADCFRDSVLSNTVLFRDDFSTLSNDFFKKNKRYIPTWTVGQLQRLIMMATGSAMYIHPDNSPMEVCMRYAEIAGFAEYFKEEDER